MKELIEIKQAWEWCVEKWRTPIGSVIFIMLAFWFGMAVKEKLIVDDCKFMGSFRDGAYSYNCSVKPR